MTKRPWNAADAVKAITWEWANELVSAFILELSYVPDYDVLVKPNEWREKYELPLLTIKEGKLVEE